MLDPIPSLPRSNQALEWNQLFESRDQHVVVAGPWLDPIGQERVWVRPREERERRGVLGLVVVHGGARWPAVVAPSQLGGRRLPWFGSAKERREERRARERERERDVLE